MEYVAIAVAFGLSAGTIGKIKGSSFWIWFLVGSVLPVFGTIAALAARWERREPRRHCRVCGKLVPLHDQVCMRCGSELEFPPEPAGGPAPAR